MTARQGAVRSTAGHIGALPLPQVELFTKPTPLEHLLRFNRALGAIAANAGHDPAVDVWVKREDLMSIGLGGNKLRNLEFHVGAALAQGANALVTSGRGRANHCRLTAAAAARAGLRCVLVLSGPRPAEPSPNERVCELLGADLRYASDSAAGTRDTLLREVLAEIRDGPGVPYEVELGASGVVGASGQVLAGMELSDQLSTMGVSPDYVFVGTATGGTYAGLRVGLWRAGLVTTVIGIPTYFSTAPSESTFRDHLALLMAELRELWGEGRSAGRSSWSDEIILDDLTSWLPYGTASPGAADAARLLGATEGIAADPVYTARVVAGITAWAGAGRLERKTVVLWHGGGTPALFEDYGP
ncbi:MAG TPA: pyridoxal-phosphate dependent enzyme [Candidatus Saccharimonadales bacterium]|nr:pyridoxal-phosphate dependent enzyme [Candidatus Saccharimonadales bacterium]